MTTFLAIVLVVLCLFNIWLAGYTIKREKQRRKQLQERMDEYDKYVLEHERTLGGYVHRVDVLLSQVADLRKLLDEKDRKIEKLNEMVSHSLGDPHAGHQDPVNGGEPSVHTEHGDPVDKLTGLSLKPVNLAALDLQDLKASYDELAKSYDFVSRQYESPSKRYIISHLVRLYDVKNLGSLAKALGVSTSSLSQKLKK